VIRAINLITFNSTSKSKLFLVSYYIEMLGNFSGSDPSSIADTYVKIEMTGRYFKHVICDTFELCSHSFSRFVLSASR